MTLRIMGIFALFFVLAGCSAAVRKDDPRHLANERFRNYAFCACIAEGFKSSEVVSEANAAAGGYVQLGSHPIEAYQEAVSLARTFLARKYTGKETDAKFTLMKCIDLYNSRELEDLIRKYEKEIRVPR